MSELAAQARTEPETTPAEAEQWAAEQLAAEIETDKARAVESAEGYARFLLWMPRGFGNEMTIYGVQAADENEVKAWLRDQDEGESKWRWLDEKEVQEELRAGVENKWYTPDGEIPCGVTEVTDWRG